jgi:hypothetical protein
MIPAMLNIKNAQQNVEPRMLETNEIIASVLFCPAAAGGGDCIFFPPG